MNTKPSEWSVIVLGAWNPAILTPGGIAQRLFKMPAGTAMDVQVPLDGLAPFRVRDKDHKLVVTAESGRLSVLVGDADFEGLNKALEMARNALEWLPETPLLAAGMNVTYEVEDPTSALLALMQSSVDTDVSELGYTVKTRALTRSLACRDGTLNLSLQLESEMSVAFNFECVSRSRESILAWVSTPVETIKADVEALMKRLGISPEGISYEHAAAKA